MGSSSLLAINMRFLIVISLTVSQISAQHGGMGSGMGGMAGMGSYGYGGMSGMGGMSGYGGMGGMGGYGGIGNGIGGMGNGMDGMGNGLGGMEGECCPMKKIWGSMNPKMDGVYVNVGKLPWSSLPYRCNSPCVFERKGGMDSMQYCFADSMYSQSECQALGEGEESVDMGEGSESPVNMGPGSGMGSENPVNMGSGSGSGSRSGSGSGSGSV